MHISPATTDAQIAATFDVMAQLRPHLSRDAYVPLIRKMIATERFHLVAAIDEERVRAVAGYRYMDMLYCGRMMYVDDLVTDEQARSRGYGKGLIDWLKREARDGGCVAVELISNVRRKDAHRFYFREGFAIEAFHFSVGL